MLKELNIIVSKYNTCNKLIDYLSSIYNVKILNEEEVTNDKQIDVVLLSSNRLVSFQTLNHKKENFIKYKKRCSFEEDKYELNLIKKFSNNKKTLFIGINTGALLLSYLSGSSIINYVTGHYNTTHEITINKFNFKSPFSSNSIELDIYTTLKRKLQLGVQLSENDYNRFIKLKQKFENNDDLLIGESNHEQMINLNNLHPDTFKLLGYSTFFMSDTYFMNEYNKDHSVIHKDFLEPEIVYYKNNNFLVFQSNPFSKNSSNSYLEESINIIKSYIK